MLSLQDLIENNQKMDLYAICESGRTYQAVFDPECKTTFFTIPREEKIVGYAPMEEGIEPHYMADVNL